MKNSPQLYESGSEWRRWEQTRDWARRQAENYEAEHSSSPGQICYLSQHFVEQLCSSEGLATELRNEMERVQGRSAD